MDGEQKQHIPCITRTQLLYQVTHNRLLALPPGLAQLTGLEELHMADNAVTVSRCILLLKTIIDALQVQNEQTASCRWNVDATVQGSA